MRYRGTIRLSCVRAGLILSLALLSAPAYSQRTPAELYERGQISYQAQEYLEAVKWLFACQIVAGSGASAEAQALLERAIADCEKNLRHGVWSVAKGDQIPVSELISLPENMGFDTPAPPAASPDNGGGTQPLVVKPGTVNAAVCEHELTKLRDRYNALRETLKRIVREHEDVAGKPVPHKQYKK